MFLFKGYLPAGGKDGKQPTESYKDRTDFYSLGDVTHLNGYCGILDDEYIQIDVDDADEGAKVLNIVTTLDIKCWILKTTRGYHFYFKNIGIQKRCQGNFTALGVSVDVGLGIQNAPIPLKINGVEREWVKRDDTIEELPQWLIPLGKEGINFSKMKGGDGRNSTLFAYILKLQSNGISKGDIRETIRIINEFILSEPLSETEIETILRDEAFMKESFYIKGRLQYQPLAEYLIDNANIIKINDILHIYDDNVYKADDKAIERVMLEYMVNSSNAQRTEIMRYLELLCENHKPASPRYVSFENGILDLNTLELAPPSESIIITNKVPHRYNPEAYSEVMDKTLNKICCNNKELRLLIEEMVGYCFLRRNEMGKAFILTGGGSNGKSTLLECIIAMLSDDNISNLALDELKSRFKTFQLAGKLANIGDDISNMYIDDNSTFKNLVTGNKVNVERKGKDAYDMRSYAKMIFSANELPRINDLSDGLKRRIIFIPFNARFSRRDSDFNPFILDELLEEESLEYLIRIGVEGLIRVLDNNKFTDCELCNKVWSEYEEINNPIIGFLKENDIENEPVSDVYTRYTVYCAECGLRALSKPVFSREILKQGFTSDTRVRIKGKQVRIYKTSF